MINLLKRLLSFFKAPQVEVKVRQFIAPTHDAYDPSQDAHRIMKGEIESYFD